MIEGALLAEAAAPARELLGYRPLTDTLEWQLAELCWAEAGLRPFLENQVPHLITSSGRLSQQAAAVLYESCLSRPPQGILSVLELGAGTGLFARYFLDAFQALCEKGGQDFYARLQYLVTDRSARTIEQWQRDGLFADHGARVLLGTCDALGPLSIQGADGQVHAPSGLRAVMCNYLLDTLPARLLVRRPGGLEELRLRTNLVADDETVRAYSELSLLELRALAQDPDASARARLLPLLTIFEQEVAYFPVDEATRALHGDLLALCPGQERLLLSHGAVRCLEAALLHLEEGGLLLINDYGPVGDELVKELVTPLRLGATMALGINFPLLAAHFTGRGLRVLSPPGDEGTLLHARLFLREEQPAVEAAFAAAFAGDARASVDGPLSEARQHLAVGRLDAALERYRTAVSASARDFLVLGEAAEFAASHLRDAALGLELAQAALKLNPWYGGWMWSVLGECLHALGRLDEAHEAHLRAARIHPREPRGQLNLSFTYGQKGQIDEALLSVARGLSADRQGLYRARLLDRQQQLLSAASSRALGEQERMARRTERMHAALSA